MAQLQTLKEEPATGNMPERKFSAGGISATVWNNVGEGKTGAVTYRTVSFQRTYKDKEGNWKTSNSLRIHDLPKAQVVLQKAYEYLVLKEMQDSTI